MLQSFVSSGRLTCPVCRGLVDGGLRNAPLSWFEVHATTPAGHPWQGSLRCTACPAIFPVIDGIAVVVADLVAWLRRNEVAVWGRADLHPSLDGFLRNAWSDTEDRNWRRQLVSVYSRGLPGVSSLPQGRAGDALSSLRAQGDAWQASRVAAWASEHAGGLWLDAGASVGTHSLALAAHGFQVVSMDTEFSALRVLSRLLAFGEAEVPWWSRGGTAFAPVTARIDDPTLAARVALVAGDVSDPPFAAAVFDGVSCLHVVDNVAEPVTALRQLNGVLAPGGRLVVSSPFDWVPEATTPRQRLGEGVSAGASPLPEDALRALLLGALPAHAPELSFAVDVSQDVPWVLVRHDRSAHVFVSRWTEGRKSARREERGDFMAP